jgi:hypothetical protein
MKINYYSFCFISLLLFNACGPGEKEKTSETDSTAAFINPSSTVTTIVETPQQPDTFLTIKEFPSDWVLLTKQNNEYIIFNSCNGNNPSVNINNNNSEENYFLSHALGQMSFAYKITGFKPLDNTHYELTCESEGQPTITTAVSYLDKEKGIARWSWRDSSNAETDLPGIFLQKEYEKNYSVVQEKNCDEIF